MIPKALQLLIVMIIGGIIMGIMFNIALGRKFFDTGAIVGGAVVGLMMYILNSGFALEG